MKDILKAIIPGKDEIKKIRKIADKIIKEINKEGYEAMLVGSAARGTFVSGENDIDIFVFFPEKTTREELEKKGVKLGKKILKKHKPTTHYAEHPYVRAKVNGFYVEIVPCYNYKNNEKLKSSVDRTPLHNKYVIDKITDKEREQIILLKKFLKANKLYGADQKVKGFSGYLCELLIINYKSFENLIKEAANNWNKRIEIDLENQRKDYSKFKNPLVVIDPVDKERNVAAAVSKTTLSRFVLKAREYEKTKNTKMFKVKKERINLKQKIKGRKIITISFKAPEIIPEILWSQLEKLTKNIKEKLYENEFDIYKTGYWTDEKKKCGIILELKQYELPIYKKNKGPEIWDKQNTEKFIEKNNDCWVHRSTIYCWKKRKYTQAIKLIEEYLTKSNSIPSYLKKTVKKPKIRKGDKTTKEKELLKFYFN